MKKKLAAKGWISRAWPKAYGGQDAPIAERGVKSLGGVGTPREFNMGVYCRKAAAAEYISGDTNYHFAKLAEAL